MSQHITLLLLIVTVLAGELEADGVIPGGINIPISVVPEAFTIMDPKTFIDLFEIPPPDRSDDIVVYCKIGKRSLSAATFLHSQGYTKVKSRHQQYQFLYLNTNTNTKNWLRSILNTNTNTPIWLRPIPNTNTNTNTGPNTNTSIPIPILFPNFTA